MTLGRGQKQRLAIARSVYARADIILIDEALCGLDRRTERQVFSQMFGTQGLHQLGSTVVFVTHASHLLSCVDQILVLGNDGKIEDQGCSENLRARTGYIRDMPIRGHADGQSNESVDDSSITSLTLDDFMRSIGSEFRDRQTGDFSVYSYYLPAA